MGWRGARGTSLPMTASKPCLPSAMNGLNFYSVGGRAATVSCVMRINQRIFDEQHLMKQRETHHKLTRLMAWKAFHASSFEPSYKEDQLSSSKDDLQNLRSIEEHHECHMLEETSGRRGGLMISWRPNVMAPIPSANISCGRYFPPSFSFFGHTDSTSTLPGSCTATSPESPSGICSKNLAGFPFRQFHGELFNGGARTHPWDYSKALFGGAFVLLCFNKSSHMRVWVFP